MTMKNFFFPQDYPSPAYSRFLLGVRLLFGILFISHGYEKLMDYEDCSIADQKHCKYSCVRCFVLLLQNQWPFGYLPSCRT